MKINEPKTPYNYIDVSASRMVRI